MPELPDRNRNPQNRRLFMVLALSITGILMSGFTARSVTKPPKILFAPKILFVCQAGTAKSAIAREIFKQRAKERGIAVEVFSRGIVVEDHISPELKQKLLHDRIDTTTEPARPLERSDWTAADILVKFNPLPASVEHNDVRDWSDLPSVNDDYANARDILDDRIDALLAEIAAAKR